MQLNYIMSGIFGFLSVVSILGALWILGTLNASIKCGETYRAGEKWGVAAFLVYLLFLAAGFSGLAWQFAEVNQILNVMALK